MKTTSINMLILLAIASALLLVTACNQEAQYNAILRPAVDQNELTAAQTTTVESIAALGRAVDQYIMMNPEIGAPKAGNIDDLINTLTTSSIVVTTDGWGNKMRYQNWLSYSPGNRNDYDLISYGEDGVKDLWMVSEHIRDARPGQDIIWRNMTNVLSKAGFTHGPTLIRADFAEFIAVSKPSE